MAVSGNGVKQGARQLLPEVREEVIYLLNANIATTKIADYVHIKTGQRLTTRDFNVIKADMIRDQQIYNQSKQESILQRIKRE